MPVDRMQTPCSGVNKYGVAAHKSRPAEPGVALRREEVSGRERGGAGREPAVEWGMSLSCPPSLGQKESGEAVSAGPGGGPCWHFPDAF